MSKFKVGDKVRVKASVFHGLEDGSICTVTDTNYAYIECTDEYGFYQWVEDKDIMKMASDLDIELAHEMNKVWDLRSKNSDLLDEMVDMLDFIESNKGCIIDDRLLSNFADRYLGGF